jgi:hypothetical protein
MQKDVDTDYIAFVKAGRSLWPKELMEYLTEERYKWGLSILNSRGLRFKGKIYLAPFADMFNYAPHPDLQVYANLSEGPIQILNYQFNYSYLTLDLKYLGRIDGASLIINNTKLWYFVGASPALLLNSELNIMTQGFTLADGNNISTYDYTVVQNANGKYSNDKGRFDIKRVYPSKINLFLNTGLRFDYSLGETMHLLLQPKVNIPLLPSAGGVQVAWCPQASIDIGIIWPLH